LIPWWWQISLMTFITAQRLCFIFCK
jgi:hypothetical protein